jgi:hypothetical protein
MLGYLAEEDAACLTSKAGEVSRLLNGLINALRPAPTKAS